MKKNIATEEKPVIREKLLPMNDMEAKAFEIELAPYKKISIQRSGVDHNDAYFWFEGKRAAKISLTPGEWRPGDRGQSTRTHFVNLLSINTATFFELEKRFDRYQLWLSKKEYVEGLRIEGLTELANSMGI